MTWGRAASIFLNFFYGAYCVLTLSASSAVVGRRKTRKRYEATICSDSLFGVSRLASVFSKDLSRICELMLIAILFSKSGPDYYRGRQGMCPRSTFSRGPKISSFHSLAFPVIFHRNNYFLPFMQTKLSSCPSLTILKCNVNFEFQNRTDITSSIFNPYPLDLQFYLL